MFAEYLWVDCSSLKESVYIRCVDHGVAGYVNYYVENNRGNLTSDTGNDPNLIIIDRWALVAYTILFFAYQIGTVIWMYVVPWSKRRTMFKKDRENRLHLLPRSIETPGPFTDTVVGAKKTKAELHDTTVVSNIDFWLKQCLISVFVFRFLHFKNKF